MRHAIDGRLETDIWLTTSALNVDPIEKKPFFHVLPGSFALSYGSVGCNLACDFCQNWRLSRRMDFKLLSPASSENIVQIAHQKGCESVAFTYNEPVISAEWCLEVAAECHKAGLKTLAVTSGYIGKDALPEFFGQMDAANVDLKGFSNDFYKQCCLGDLQTVLETLEFLANSRTWLEVTTLLIPGRNDDEKLIEDQCKWMFEHLGPEVPLHFSAFHPSYKALETVPTSIDALRLARKIAIECGLRFVYIGNLRDMEGSSTVCPSCGNTQVVRNGFSLEQNYLIKGVCSKCSKGIPGIW